MRLVNRVVCVDDRLEAAAQAQEAEERQRSELESEFDTFAAATPSSGLSAAAAPAGNTAQDVESVRETFD